jgi:hypothetical protein
MNLKTHSVTAAATLKFGSEVWVLKKRVEERMETSQTNLCLLDRASLVQ